MSSISIEHPPEGTDLLLSEYLNRMLVNINNALGQTSFNNPLYTVPDKLQVGRVYYFGAAVLPNISAEGLYVYKSTGWVQLG